MPATLKLTPAACQEGSVAAVANARRLSLAASCLRRAGHHGPAVALYVASLEEAVKGLALFFAGETSENGEVRPDLEEALRGLLRGPNSHVRRHAVASLGKVLQTCATLPRDSQTPRMAQFVLGLGLVFLILTGDKEVLEEFALTAVTAGLTAGPEARQGWFERAWDLRNAGLYVDWSRGAWRSPAQIGAEDASEARQEVIGIVRTMLLVGREPLTAEELASLPQVS